MSSKLIVILQSFTINMNYGIVRRSTNSTLKFHTFQSLITSFFNSEIILALKNLPMKNS